jgi:hypothetical protein
MAKQFLNKNGLETFFTKLTEIFATKNAVSEVKENTDPYILEIDYTVLEFNVDQLAAGITE